MYGSEEHLMDGLDVVAKLCMLKDNRNGLTEDDAAFVAGMVARHEGGELLDRHQILRIVDMAVPGEPPKQPDVLTFDLVNVVFVLPDETIWCYMPLEQLFALLSTKTLHFSPLAVMDDIAEGQLPGRAWEDTKKHLPDDILEGRGTMDADTMMGIMVSQRRTDACINCWYLDGSDSMKMWQEYAPRNGVAVQSTVQNLASSLQAANTSVTISPVTYFDPDEEDKYVSEALYGSLYIKRDPFRHERELRALVYRTNIGCGVDVPVDLEVLIERLVLSPELKDWAVPFITEVIRHYGFVGCIEKWALAAS